jgi:hypothetical protein
MRVKGSLGLRGRLTPESPSRRTPPWPAGVRLLALYRAGDSGQIIGRLDTPGHLAPFRHKEFTRDHTRRGQTKGPVPPILIASSVVRRTPRISYEASEPGMPTAVPRQLHPLVGRPHGRTATVNSLLSTFGLHQVALLPFSE